MRTLVAAGVLLVSVGAWAVSQQDFQDFFRKSTGITDFVITTKRACVCRGGQLDSRAGWAVLALTGLDGRSDQTSFVECTVPRWGSDGQETEEMGCVAEGGAVEVLSK